MSTVTLGTSWRLLRHNHLGMFGLSLLVFFAALALLVPWLPLHDPNITDPAQRLLRPLEQASHWLGTDSLGRDELSRLAWGLRVSLVVGLSATLIAAVIGSLIGLVAGFAGGRTDNIMMRGIDMLMSFPYILLALAIVAVLGPGLINALYAIAIVNIPFFARNVRGVTLGLAEREFVDAARLSGKSPSRILFTEILPNVMPVIVITISTTLGWMILETAGLSFLGLGAQPPQADLGSMLGEGRKLMYVAPHVTVLPGLVIFVLVMAINLTGDALRDVLDPRLRAGVLGRPAPRTQIRTKINSDFDSKTEPNNPLLRVQGLQTSITQGVDEYPAVQEVSFELAQGECLGLVGESGSGKTLTALSLTGLVASPPGVITGGVAHFEGRNLFTLNDEQIRQLRGGAIAHVFQDSLSALHPLFTVGDQLIEAIQAHQALSRKQARELAIKLLERVRIPQPAQRLSAYPSALSGGMRQRLSIAMALANQPKLIIADEPTTALDVTVQAQVLHQFDQLRREYNTAVLFITHDFAVVSQIADRVAVMYAGRIVESGVTADVMNTPAHPYTRMLLDCVPQLGTPGREIQAIPGHPPVLSEPQPGCAFASRCAYAQEKCYANEPVLSQLESERQVRCYFPLTDSRTKPLTEGS